MISVFIADGVQLSGRVWCWGCEYLVQFCVLHSSGKDIVIGDQTNIQDGSVYGDKRLGIRRS